LTLAWPRAKEARAIVGHFHDYARGNGQSQRRIMSELAVDVSSGRWLRPVHRGNHREPFVMAVSAAVEASNRLHVAIYEPGRAFDAARRPNQR
jgi:hypothetical protein